MTGINGMVLLLYMEEQNGLKLAEESGESKQSEIKDNGQAGENIIKHAVQTGHSPFREEILEMDHLHHDGHILLRSRAQVVFDVTLSLELEHHLFNRHALPADTAELVPQPVRHTFQSILDEGLPLRAHRDTTVEWTLKTKSLEVVET